MPLQARREATKAFYRVDFQCFGWRTFHREADRNRAWHPLRHFTRLLEVCGLLFSVPKGERLETESRAAGKGDR